jgi:aldose 1-epimerase
MEIITSKFGMLPDGSKAELITLKNDNDVTISITTYGAIITSVLTPDKNGNIENVVCGFNNLEDYLDEKYLNSYPYFGAICGRVANRIAKGKFTLEGVMNTRWL